MAPVLGTVLEHVLSEFLVFLSRPWTLDHAGVEYFLPPM